MIGSTPTGWALGKIVSLGRDSGNGLMIVELPRLGKEIMRLFVVDASCQAHRFRLLSKASVSNQTEGAEDVANEGCLSTMTGGFRIIILNFIQLRSSSITKEKKR
jgi:hypothetical protein